jgi:hypothetical protein
MRDWHRYLIGALIGALVVIFLFALAPNVTERTACNVAAQPEVCLARAAGGDGWRLVEVQTVAGVPFVILERPRIRI